MATPTDNANHARSRQVKRWARRRISMEDAARYGFNKQISSRQWQGWPVRRQPTGVGGTPQACWVASCTGEQPPASAPPMPKPEGRCRAGRVPPDMDSGETSPSFGVAHAEFPTFAFSRSPPGWSGFQWPVTVPGRAARDAKDPDTSGEPSRALGGCAAWFGTPPGGTEDVL
jgi:hypothetical protein